MEDSKLKALIILLEDKDAEVYKAARKSLLSNENITAASLEKYKNESDNKLLIKRLQKIINIIRFRNLKREFVLWLENDDNELLYGAYLTAKLKYPHLEYEVVEKKVAEIAFSIRPQLNTFLTNLQQIRVVNHALYEILKFESSVPQDFIDDHALINSIIENKKACDTGMAVLYVSVCKKLNIPVKGVNLPRNFIALFADPEKPDNPEAVLFYINPFNRGALLSRKEIDSFLSKSRIPAKPEYYVPCRNKDFVGRLIASVVQTYGDKKTTKARYYKKLYEFYQSVAPGNYTV